jgi:phosphatidylserine/phosphatidylglycerophosphate/cardiolipin synthase-like enzyme
MSHSDAQQGTRVKKYSYLTTVEKELNQVAPELAGTVWERTSGNALDASDDNPARWILQVPDAWGWTGSPESVMPPGAEKTGIKALLARVRDVISRAERCVDITCFGPPENTSLMLGPFPDGKFARVMGESLAAAAMAASQHGRKLKVRVLAGVAGAAPADPKAFHHELKQMLGEYYYSAVDLNVASMTTRGMSSYNHTGLVLMDGRSVIHGGINWRANYYYQDSGLLWDSNGCGDWAPVTDMDMALDGPAALSAGRFLDTLWTWTCDNASVTNEPQKPAWLATRNDTLDQAIRTLYQDSKPARAGELDVIAIGGLGYGIVDSHATSRYQPPPAVQVEQAACEYWLDGPKSDNETNTDRDFMVVNPDVSALRALIGCAQQSIVLSQQDISGYANAPLHQALFDVRLFDILAAKMISGVKVRIVLSSPGSPDYSNINDIREETVRPLFNRVRLRTDSAAAEVLKENLQLAPLRVSAAETWLNRHKYRLHTKIVCVDNTAFYLGSRNLCPGTTQDFGFIIEDAAAAQQLSTIFLDPEWRYSKNAAIYDCDDPTLETPQFEDQKPRQTLYLDAVESGLKDVSPGLAGTVWERTSGNLLAAPGEDPASWLLQVPDLWGWRGAIPQGSAKAWHRGSSRPDTHRHLQGGTLRGHHGLRDAGPGDGGRAVAGQGVPGRRVRAGHGRRARHRRAGRCPERAQAQGASPVRRARLRVGEARPEGLPRSATATARPGLLRRGDQRRIDDHTRHYVLQPYQVHPGRRPGSHPRRHQLDGELLLSGRIPA